MAINPLQLPSSQAFTPSIDWSPLAKLGDTYQQGQKEQKLSDLGKGLADGSINYRQAAGTLAELGSIDGSMKFLALAEAQKKQADELKAHQGFTSGVGGIFDGGGSQTTATPATAPVRTSNVASDKIYTNDEPSPLDPPSGRDRDLAIRTIVGEAGNQSPQGQAAVASVIRNRAVNGGYGGDTPAGVVMAPNQFEPWNGGPARDRMMALSPNDPQYQRAGQALDSAYAGNDPTNGAVNFIAPQAQAALGRQMPSWAQGPGQDIGDHRFFGGAGQGSYQVAGPATAAPGAKPPAADDDDAPTAGRPAPSIPGANGIGSPQSIQKLVAAMSDPRLPEQDKAVAKTLLEHALKVSDLPETQKNYALYVAQTNARGGKADDFTTWSRANSAASKTEISVDTKGENAFASAAGGAIAKRFEKLTEEGENAKSDLALIGQLRDLRGVVGGGAPAAIQGWLAERGIKVGDNVGAVEAYGSIIDKLTPQQRIPGSGSTSDYEGRMFKNSLPKLINTPEGNAVIESTLAGLAQYKLDRAAIAEKGLSRELTQAETLKQMRELPSPYDNFKKFQQNGFKADPSNPASVAPPEPKPTAKFSEQEIGQSLQNARAAIAKNPAARDAIIKKLSESGLDASAL